MGGKDIWVVGGDRRQAVLAELLREDGHRVYTAALEREAGEGQPDLTGIGRAQCVILPLPALDGAGKLFTPLSGAELRAETLLDAMEPGQLLCCGMAGPELEKLARARGVELRDYGADGALAVLNAVPTAEGAIRIAMEELSVTIHECRALVLGLGRIGTALVQRLRGLGAVVTAAARKPETRAAARTMGAESVGFSGLKDRLGEYDLVFNTVPAPVLGREELAALKKGAVVIDLASRPGGTDFEVAEKLGIRCVHALALPGKAAPVTAGKYIREAVYHIMEESGV